MNRVSLHSAVFGDSVRQKDYATGLIPDVKAVENQVVNLYPRKLYQSFEGFGAALTEAAGWTLSRMSGAKRREVLEACYGEGGLGYTLGRVSMDSCDFSLGPYCAVRQADAGFADFSLERDAKYVQPLLREVAQAAGKPPKLLMSPWSPPEFMKDTGARNGGGRLKKEWYQPYAEYIARYLLEYKKLGFPVAMLTVQNEPLAAQLWDSCEYSAGEEKDFLKNHLAPALQKNGLGDVELYIWDHNKERLYERVRGILDGETEKMVAGAAYHWYSGDHFEALQMVREDFPSLKLMHSEGCVELARNAGRTGTGAEHARRYAHDMIGDMNHGMNSWIDWNLALDENGGPNHVGNFCDAPIRCDTAADTVCYQPTFYAIAQFSRYIRPGAVRIGLSRCSPDLEATAFKNADGALAAVFLNPGEGREVSLRTEGKTAKLPIPPRSVSTAVIR